MKASTFEKMLALIALPVALAMPAALQCGVGGDGDNFYTSSTVGTELVCIFTCENDINCLSSEFKPSNGKCWLYAKTVAEAKVGDDNSGTYIFNDKRSEEHTSELQSHS